MNHGSLTQKLTRFPEGSVRELWTVSFPLILSAMSGSIMIFFDRLILARYNVEHMNAAASASTVAFMFQFWVIGIAAIAEVFVGQHNGAGEKHRLGEPVWQMVWFCLASTVAFIPLALWSGPYLMAPAYHEAGLPYYKWIMGGGMLMALIPALSAFFIGQGRVRFVLFCTIIGNSINIVLDYLFVFDLLNWGVVPAGSEGAAIATVISQVVTVGLLAYMFLKKEYRKKYGTNQWQFKWKPFWDCFRIGVPNATGHLIEIGAWAVLFQIVAMRGQVHTTVMAVGQSIFILTAFVADGLSKGVIAVASNLIGAKRPDTIDSVLKSARKLGFILSAVVAVPLILYPDPFLKGFLNPSELPIVLASMETILRWALVFVWLFFVFDIFTWGLAGILTAAGDTKFVMFMNATTSWVCAVIPMYYFMVLRDGSPILTWVLAAFYASINMCLFLWRYKTGKWRSMKIES